VVERNALEVTVRLAALGLIPLNELENIRVHLAGPGMNAKGMTKFLVSNAMLKVAPGVGASDAALQLYGFLSDVLAGKKMKVLDIPPVDGSKIGTNEVADGNVDSKMLRNNVGENQYVRVQAEATHIILHVLGGEEKKLIRRVAIERSALNNLLNAGEIAEGMGDNNKEYVLDVDSDDGLLIVSPKGDSVPLIQVIADAVRELSELKFSFDAVEPIGFDEFLKEGNDTLRVNVTRALAHFVPAAYAEYRKIKDSHTATARVDAYTFALNVYRKWIGGAE